MTDPRDPDFYLAHAGYVRALARRLVYDAHAADDLAQAAWLAALQRPARDASAPRAWLASIVRNLAGKLLLGATRRRRRELQQEPPPPSSSPDDVVAHEHERRRVVAALLELEEPVRATLIARFFDGLEPAAIALRDGVPVETVRTRIKRGMQRLRERLLRDGASAFVFAHGLRLGEPGVGAMFVHLWRGVFLMQAKNVVVAAGVLVLAAAVWWSLHDASPKSVTSAAGPEPVPVAAPAVPAVAAPIPVDSLPEAARTAELPAAPTGALAVQVVWSDRRAAAGVAVRVGSFAACNVEASVVDARTDRDGRARFEHLGAGDVFVECDRGTSRRCTIRAGECAEARLEIAAGAHVRGRVLDVDGSPAAGAEVYLLYRPSAHAGHVVATADADGTFALDDAPADRTFSLSAFLPQRAPTPQWIGNPAAGKTVDVELRFAARGGAIAGSVTDETGAPVAATVVVGAREIAFELMRPRGNDAPPLESRRAKCDALGAWLVEGVAAGDTPVLVFAPGMATWEGRVFVVENGLVHCDAVMAKGARLIGTVRDERGAPVARAEVRVGSFGLKSALTAADGDGVFLLDSVPIGAFTVAAKAEGAGEARAEFIGVAGAELRWDATLLRATTLRGRVTANGGAVAGARVSARCMPASMQQWFADATSGGDGAFEFTNCPAALLHLDVFSPTSGSFVVATRDDVDPHGGEVLLEVEASREPSAFVTGRVVDPNGDAVAGAEVTVLSASPDITGGHVVRTGADGRFLTPGCPPGEWFLFVHADGWSRLGAPRRTLTVGATTDFGDLRLVRGQNLVVTLQPDGGVDLTGLVIALGDANCGIATREPTNGILRFPDVGPGDYELVAYARGVAQRRVTVRVSPDVETCVALPLSAGTEVRVDVRDERREPMVDRLETELIDGSGACIDRTPLTPGAEPMSWQRRLVAGTYELRLRDHRGRIVAVPLVVPAAGKAMHTTARFR